MDLVDAAGFRIPSRTGMNDDRRRRRGTGEGRGCVKVSSVVMHTLAKLSLGAGDRQQNIDPALAALGERRPNKAERRVGIKPGIDIGAGV